MAFLETIWQWILNIFGSFDSFLEETIQFDKLALDFFNNVIVPLPEWLKIIGTLGLVFIIVFGIVGIAKKLLKVLIFVVVILVIIILVRNFL